MGRRTLASTWKHLERLARRYDRADGDACDKAIADLDELVGKANDSRVADALATLFVHNYPDLEDVSVQFAQSEEGEYPDWITSYSEEDQTIYINTLGIVHFREECRQAAPRLKKPEGRENFFKYRYNAYLVQLKKLPSQYHLFMHLLKEVGRIRKITRVQKKKGGIERAEDEIYTLLLWGFNEMERFLIKTGGIDLRSEYEISWYESEWFVGKDKSRGR